MPFIFDWQCEKEEEKQESVLQLQWVSMNSRLLLLLLRRKLSFVCDTQRTAWQYQWCSHFFVTMGILLYFSCQIQVKKMLCYAIIGDVEYGIFFLLCCRLNISLPFIFQTWTYFSVHFIHTVSEITTHTYTDFVHNNNWSSD